MATYKTLNDYHASESAQVFEEILMMIHSDFVKGIIDQNNREEPLEDLQSEIEEARIERMQARIGE